VLGVLQDAHLTKDRFDDRFATSIDRPAFRGSQFAGHTLLARGVLGDRATRGNRRWVVTASSPGGHIELGAVIVAELHRLLEVLG
jgi:hypothetical protein